MKTKADSLPTEEELRELERQSGSYTGDVEQIVWRVQDYAKSRDATRPRATLADIGLLYMFAESLRMDAELLTDHARTLEKYLGPGATLDQLRHGATADLPAGALTQEEIDEILASYSEEDEGAPDA